MSSHVSEGHMMTLLPANMSKTCQSVSVFLCVLLQGETKILKLKNLRPQDYAEYTCIASIRHVCGIGDKSALFNLNNRTGNTHKTTKTQIFVSFFRDVAVKNQFPFPFLWLLGFFLNSKKFVFFWSPDQIQHNIYRIRLFKNFCSVSEKSSKASS